MEIEMGLFADRLASWEDPICFANGWVTEALYEERALEHELRVPVYTGVNGYYSEQKHMQILPRVIVETSSKVNHSWVYAFICVMEWVRRPLPEKEV